MTRKCVLILLPLLLTPHLLFAQRQLRGTVEVLDERGNFVEVAVNVTVVETQGSDETNDKGFFRISLPDVFRGGDDIELRVNKPDYVIYEPRGGKARIPADLERDQIKVQLMKKGAPPLLSPEAIASLIEDFSDKAKEVERQEQQEPDLSRYIKDWALEYGFNADQAMGEVRKWVAEVREKSDDFYKLGLAAFAEKQFSEAAEQFNKSAEEKEKVYRELVDEAERIEEETRQQRQEIIRDRRLEGNSYYYADAFEEALAAYRKALEYATREEEPQRWAATLNNIGNTHRKIAERVVGDAIHTNLEASIDAFEKALEVYTRESLPQQWALTQNNLGAALQELGTRRGGSELVTTLAASESAYRSALEVYTRESLPQQWAWTQNNLGNTLQALGTRRGGSESVTTLAASESAYRSALEVYTREALPQQWITSHYGLITTLRELSNRSGDQEAQRLAEEVIAGYQALLEMITRDVSPGGWAQLQEEMGHVLFDQALRSRYEEAVLLLEDAAEAWQHAIEVHTREEDPGFWSNTQNNLGNVYTILGQYDIAVARFKDCLLPRPDYQEGHIALKAVQIASLLVERQTQTLVTALEALIDQLGGQSGEIHMEWPLRGAEVFISQNQSLAPHQQWLAQFFVAIQAESREAIVAGLQAAMADLDE